jgi:hypothetical protein
MPAKKAQVGAVHSSVVLETCLEHGKSRPRVRPLTVFPESIRVEFPRNFREDYPIGTQFTADVKVCQKTQSGVPSGPIYLRAIVDTIQLRTASLKASGVHAVRRPTKSDRAYDHVVKKSKVRPARP